MCTLILLNIYYRSAFVYAGVYTCIGICLAIWYSLLITVNVQKKYYAATHSLIASDKCRASAKKNREFMLRHTLLSAN